MPIWTVRFGSIDQAFFHRAAEGRAVVKTRAQVVVADVDTLQALHQWRAE